MTIAVCPGSFDPVTLGHLDVIRRGALLFDEVVVAVAAHAGKQPLLSVAERVELLRTATQGIGGVRVGVADGLIVDFCREVGASVLLKGLRGSGDHDAELPMAWMNRHLAGIETLFLPADRAVAHIASSMVKDVARHGGRIEDLVPDGVAPLVRQRLAPAGGTGER